MHLTSAQGSTGVWQRFPVKPSGQSQVPLSLQVPLFMQAPHESSLPQRLLTMPQTRLPQETVGQVWQRLPVQSLTQLQAPFEHVPPCSHVIPSQGSTRVWQRFPVKPSGQSHVPFPVQVPPFMQDPHDSLPPH